MEKKISFKTLGCRLNQYETDALASTFTKEGFSIVPFDQEADVCVVNTCTVTNQSDHKSRNIISQAARKSPKGLVVVTGCMAEGYTPAFSAEEAQVYVVDNTRKFSIPQLVEAHYRGETFAPERQEQDVFGFGPVEHGLHTRSFIKIQDGCDNFCTFCIIPMVRGKAASRPIDSILDDVRQTVANGFKELVITGVNIGRYDNNGLTFEDVLQQILDVPGDFRVRISSLEPDGLSPRFAELFSHPKMCPHLHLCLQSGSERILLEMRRMYSAAQFRQTVEAIRNQFPHFNFTTDVITGFPGETEQDFEDTADMVRELGFSHVHTFRYSRRQGTRADRMENQIPEKVKVARSEAIRNLSAKNKEEYYRSFMGKEQVVLIERVSRGVGKGYGQHYIPVETAASPAEVNTFVKVRITGLKGEGDKLVALAERMA
ncbi:MAG TPA: tRNA (N(6)-L-threonylcarbamoyladenosine(37)-C(2))-methylthiotransferase MtaB [Williamwhitmania sp.]|nr:tRNA (N(6)-L-threonylcarbamoyladenosine(37)-C(2))-methylthiotransferase MtaB [Williamwhitmania sp.]